MKLNELSIEMDARVISARVVRPIPQAAYRLESLIDRDKWLAELVWPHETRTIDNIRSLYIYVRTRKCHRALCVREEKLPLTRRGGIATTL